MMRNVRSKNNAKYLVVFILMLIVAFYRCYQATHDIFWAYEPDFDRDIGLIQGTLEGHFGEDPNYLGEFIWYNPMIFLLEAAIVKISSLPIHIVVARAGPFLNLLSPIAFFLMVRKLFDNKLAIASALSFLFLASSDINCWGAATYSPWLIADSFVQFIFYLNIIFCYKAFAEQKMRWFLILGVSLGISFLGHTAPTILIILITISLQGKRMIKAIKEKNLSDLKKYILQGIGTFIPFALVSLPFSYFVVIKYHLHIVNRGIVEFADGIFNVYNFVDLIKANLSFSLIIAIIGFIWFWKKFHQGIVREIILTWVFTSIFMFVYEALLPKMDHVFNIFLPDTVPSFHYFFYLKAVQSVFFGFGFLFLINQVILLVKHIGKDKLDSAFSRLFLNNVFLLSIILYLLIYYPIYANRGDFVDRRELALAKGNDKDRIEVYSFISKNLSFENVILCEYDLSIFPVMASGKKMVSVVETFSNPYVNYEKRETDRNNMLSYLKNAVPASARKLFYDYKVDYVLLSNVEFAKLKFPLFLPSHIIFRNNSFTIISLNAGYE